MLDAFGAVLVVRVLAGVAGVVQLHYGVVELGELLVLGCGPGGELLCRVVDGG